MNLHRPIARLILILSLAAITGCKNKQTGSPRASHILNEITLVERDQFFDSHDEQRATSYLYAPGLMGSEILMGRYCPCFSACTGEKISWKSGGHVIGKPHSAVTFPEINMKKPGGATLNPITAWIDGARADFFPLAQRFMQETFEFSIKDNPASSLSVANYTFNFSQGNIAQEKDIQALHKAYKNHIKHYPNTDIILYGDSRGAATAFNFIALHKPAQVKAAVLEGIFDDIPHVIKHLLYVDKEKRAEERLHDILNFVMGSYSKKGPFPFHYAEKMSDDIPLLFVTSLKDGLVPTQSTLNIYNQLQTRGHKKIHLLVLKNSFHPCYMIGNAEDKDLYESVVHAFYKEYGLPHNSEKAEQGRAEFEKTQPTSKEVARLYELEQCPLCAHS
jgi:hypothetical protein